MQIRKLDSELYTRFKSRIVYDATLGRSLVGARERKSQRIYRWFNYKEAFSPRLVSEFLNPLFNSTPGKLLDPFAGTGTSLIASASLGWTADGIEISPIGNTVIKAVKAAGCLSRDELERLKFWGKEKPWAHTPPGKINTYRVTQGAYSPETEAAIGSFLTAVNSESSKLKEILTLALIGILESVSYTSKDGSFLRWDHRSLRNTKSLHDKGEIRPFAEAMVDKIREICEDISSGIFNTGFTDKINISIGSSLELMDKIPDKTYDSVVTSPPYCNRYDYTRNYALELAAIGVSDDELKGLRQDMLTSNADIRPKSLDRWPLAVSAADSSPLLQAVLKSLEGMKSLNLLNNNGILRMVRGYFYELSCIIYECFRVLKSGGRVYMVNDNVRHAGINISVDLILSDIAETLGFVTDKIVVLPFAKGNSPQQMKIYGKAGLRKSIYYWTKP